MTSDPPVLSPELLKKIQHIYIKGRYLANDVFAGEYETAFRGRGIEFEEVREYIPGDDIRSIDWNVSARMGRPFIKVYREEREQTLMLLVDASASGNFGSVKKPKRDVVGEIAAVLAYAAVKSNDKVGLIIFTDRVERYIPPKKGRGHVWHVISEILSFKPEGKKTDMREALNYFNRVARRRSICFVISDFFAEDYETSLKFARFKHDVIALMINDALEKSFPKGAWMSFKDLETGSLISLDMGNRRTREAYLAARADDMNKKISQFRSMNLDLLTIQTNQDYIDPLLRFFRMREKRL